jgi:hypothetical protein
MKKVMSVRGYVVAQSNKKELREGRPAFQVFTKEEWSCGEGCRYPEYDDCCSLDECLMYIGEPPAEKEIINKMTETIAYIRDAVKNADPCYSSETIKMNMSNYFTGLAFAMEALTGREFSFGYNGKQYRLVEIVKGAEITYCTIPAAEEEKICQE